MPLRPCWVEINTRALEENYRFLASLAAPHAELLAIVKAAAYGHGLALCAQAAVRAGARWLGVTSVEEGVAARSLCPSAQVLVLGGIFPGQEAEVVRHSLAVVAWEPAQLNELQAAAHAEGAKAGSIAVHLEMDTGMSRQGVALNGAKLDRLEEVLSCFHPASPLRLDGVMTHLFAADESDGRATEEQLRRLDAALGRIGAMGLLPDWLNVGNSAALLSGQASGIAELAARHGMKAMLRPGLALYGLAPQFAPEEPAAVTAAKLHLRPVLQWKSKVVGLRSIPAGAVVGYNGTFVATEPMRLALVAAGYADGLDRKLGNRFSLLLHGQRAPLAGRISMDQSVIDVTEIANIAIGDEVVILGTQGDETNTAVQTISAFDHAEASETIPWEVFTRIGQRVQRVPV